MNIWQLERSLICKSNGTYEHTFNIDHSNHEYLNILIGYKLLKRSSKFKINNIGFRAYFTNKALSALPEAMQNCRCTAIPKGRNKNICLIKITNILPH